MPDLMHSGIGNNRHSRSAEEIAQWLVSAVAQQTKMPIEQIDVRAPFAHFGMGSVDSLILTGRMEQWLGYELPATVLWDYGSIRKLSAHLGAIDTKV